MDNCIRGIKTGFTGMKKNRKAFVRDNLFGWSLVILSVIHFFIFWIYVNFDTILMTFQRFNVYTGELEWYGLNNYIQIFKEMVLGENASMQRAFFNSFQAIAINLIILPIAIFSAYAFYKKMPCTTFFSVIFYIPQLISIVVLTMSFRYMFSADFGPIALLVAKIKGVESVDLISVESNFLWPVIWLFCIWSGLGANVIMMRGAMNKIPKEVSESAILEGCGFFQELIYITLPMSLSTIGIYFIQTMGAASGFLMPPMLIAQSGGDNGRFMTTAWYIFGNANSSSAGAIITVTTVGVLFTLLNTPLIVGTRILVKKITPDLS